MSKITAETVVGLTQSFVREHTTPLIPGQPYQTETLLAYDRLYGKIVRSAELLGGRNMFHRIWDIDGRPVLAASNNPVPENPNNLHEWKVDVASIVHGDKISNSTADSENTFVENGFIHGSGAADLAWGSIPAIAGITNAPDSVNVVALVYPTEEWGNGEDIRQLVENGFSPTITLCVDGEPLSEGSGLISIVDKAKGAIRAHLTISDREATHSARIRDAELPTIPWKIHALLSGLRDAVPGVEDPSRLPWEETTYNTVFRSGNVINATARNGYVGFDVRVSSDEKMRESLTLLRELAERHGFSLRADKLDVFSQDIDDPFVQEFASSARKEVGEDQVIYHRDAGSMDLRHIPQKGRKGTPSTRILSGVRSDNWHSGTSRERLSIEAAVGYINATVDFIRKLGNKF